MPYIYNNQDLSGQFIIGDTQYPSNWLDLSTPEEREAIGISWVEPTPYIPTTQDIISQTTNALEQYYDSKAQERRYDNRLTCALRAGYAGPFQSEGTSFAIWMDTCNAYAYQVMSDVQNGLRSIPTPQELIMEFPILNW